MESQPPDTPSLSHLETTPLPKPQPQTFNFKTVLRVISLVIFFALVTFILYYQTFSSRIQAPDAQLPKTSQGPISSPPPNHDLVINSECFSTNLNLKLSTLPYGWSCEAEDFGDSDGSLLLNSATTKISISTLGRGGPCGQQPDQDCNSQSFYSNDLIETKTYLGNTERGEIFGMFSNGATLSVTLSSADNRKINELNDTEISEIKSILSELKLINLNYQVDKVISQGRRDEQHIGFITLHLEQEPNALTQVTFNYQLPLNIQKIDRLAYSSTNQPTSEIVFKDIENPKYLAQLLVGHSGTEFPNTETIEETKIINNKSFKIEKIYSNKKLVKLLYSFTTTVLGNDQATLVSYIGLDDETTELETDSRAIIRLENLISSINIISIEEQN